MLPILDRNSACKTPLRSYVSQLMDPKRITKGFLSNSTFMYGVLLKWHISHRLHMENALEAYLWSVCLATFYSICYKILTPVCKYINSNLSHKVLHNTFKRNVKTIGVGVMFYCSISVFDVTILLAWVK